MRVLVFGGSFDPCHRGHAALLSAAARAVRPERIVVVPAWRAPLKSVEPSAPARERAVLVRLGLIERLPRKIRRMSRVDLSEIDARRQVYTVETLARLQALEPRAELHFVCGQDAAASFPRWKDPPRLKRLASWWYGARPSAPAPPSFFRRVPGRFPDLSSTELRSALALGQDGSDALFPEVLARIEARGLYGRGLLRRLRGTLKPSRYQHTLNVAALAEALARRHGEDPAKARLAGILHDAGRRFPPPLMAEYARAKRLAVPRRELTAALEPTLLHAYISEDLARKEFSVDDKDVLSAIRKHTLGDVRMSRLDRLVYVADACSADRAHAGAAATRALAFMDLDAAFERCLADKLTHALARRAWLHPLTLELWNSLAAR